MNLPYINYITKSNLKESDLRELQRLIEEEGIGCTKKRMYTGKVENGKKEQVNCVHLHLSLLGEEYEKLYKGICWFFFKLYHYFIALTGFFLVFSCQFARALTMVEGAWTTILFCFVWSSYCSLLLYY